MATDCDSTSDSVDKMNDSLEIYVLSGKSVLLISPRTNFKTMQA